MDKNTAMLEQLQVSSVEKACDNAPQINRMAG